ncbi:MAG: peroxiredoxin [Synechococcales bacterium]|nr:peroxiredoxin [Synechococcales bacterium]
MLRKIQVGVIRSHFYSQLRSQLRLWFHGQGRWAIALVLCLINCLWLLPSPAYAMGGKLPSLNQPAPEFALPTQMEQGTVHLSDYRGKWLVLYFYPQDFTSGCTLEARRFQQDLPQYHQRNAEVVGVSSDSVGSHAEFCDAEGLKFPLLADADGTVSKAYGSWLGVRSARHTYIIDPESQLRATFLGVNPILHSQEVLAKLQELQGE